MPALRIPGPNAAVFGKVGRIISYDNLHQFFPGDNEEAVSARAPQFDEDEDEAGNRRRT